MLLTKNLKIKVNKECSQYLEMASERCRLLYNFSLQEKIDHYKDTGKYLGLYEHKKTLTDVKKEFPEYANVYNKCLSVMHFRLDKAFKSFFRRLRDPKCNHKGFPRFKRHGIFISQEYPAMFIKQIDNHQFVLPSGGRNKNFIVRTYERIPSNYRTIIITKKKDQYFATFIYELDVIQNKNSTEGILALDLGVKTLVEGMTLEGINITVPKFSHHTKHLDTLRSRRDKAKKGSNTWKKHNTLFQSRLDKYKNRIKDYLHKASKFITNSSNYNTIVVGKLNLNNMKSDQTWFNKIVCNEWRVKSFVDMLRYKSIKFSKNFSEISERNTTKTCYNCGQLKDMSLSDRTYTCPHCGINIDRDLNSAYNILKKYCTASAVNTLDKCELIRYNLNNEKYNLVKLKYVLN